MNLQSAMEFVLNVEADMISIDPVVFATKCAENEQKLFSSSSNSSSSNNITENISNTA